jgi:hypothetical protein
MCGVCGNVGPSATTWQAKQRLRPLQQDRLVSPQDRSLVVLFLRSISVFTAPAG